MKKNIFYILLFVIFSYSIIYGQISTEELPISFRTNIPELTKNENTYKILPPLEMKKLEMEDLEDEENGIPPRFGFPHEVSFNLDNAGEWIELTNGDKIWRLIISCPNALSINLLYDSFWIPEYGKFFIYSNNLEFHIGAFTYENNKGEKENIQGFATGLIYSDLITLEYYLPKNTEDIGIISIAYVVQGYKYITIDNNTREYGSSQSCNININCPEGQNWQNEKNSVALILVNGNRYCTGSLVNTTANDNRLLFLTADHCLGGWANSVKHDAITAPNLSHWSFYWHYESPGCMNAVPAIYSTSSATVVANNQTSDFALLELKEHPAKKTGVTPYFLGWDCSGNAGSSGVGIHHPRGDIKKISQTNNIVNHSGTINWNDGTTSPRNTHWDATFYNGLLEGGSSGSPLINNNRRIIGQLHGGPTPICLQNYIMRYGKFSVSWTGNNASDSRRRLKDWLDPNNSGVTTLNGKDCNLSINNQTYSSGTHSITGCTVTISNTTIEPNTTVRIHGQQSVTLKPGTHAKTGSNVRITAGTQTPESKNLSDSPPNYDNTEVISLLEELSSETLSVNSLEINGVDFFIYPNPNDGNFTIKISGEIQPYTVEVFNSLGGLLGYVNCNDEIVNINRTDLNTGIYYVKITMNEKVVVKKVIIK